MRCSIFRALLALGLVAGCMMSGGPRLLAQEPPKVDEILDKEAEAVGGKEVNQKVKTMVMNGKISVGDTKLQFDVQFAPDRYYKALAIEGIGKEEVVVNGQKVWKQNSITGSEILQGDERAKTLREAAEMSDVFLRVGNWRKQFKNFKSLGEEKVDGKPAYKVHLTNQDGSTWIDYFDKQSGLMVRRDILDPTQNKVTMVQRYGDFRKVDGVVHAFTVKIGDGPGAMVVTIKRIEQNVAIPEERFAMPAELRKLAEKQK